MIDGIAEIYNIIGLATFSIKSNIYIAFFLSSFYLYFKYLINDHQYVIFKDLLHIIELFLAILEGIFTIRLDD